MARRDQHVSLAHGNGGRLMRELIEELFVPALGNPLLDTCADAVGLPTPDDLELVVTTDGFTVQPLEFPGGNIGSLAVHGTVNDLAVSGAQPRFMTLSTFLEEGLPIETLRRVIASMAEAARECGVAVVAGDTKVLGRGDCDGIYLAATGVGFRPRGTALALGQVRAGDRILVSGPVGDHGAAVLLARQEFGLRGDLESDAASVLPEAQALLAVPGLRFMRDPTRGGLATTLNELATQSGCGMVIRERDLPVKPQVAAACEFLGLDPLYVANEGKLVAIVPGADAARLLAAMRAHPLGRDAAIVGEVIQDSLHFVQMETSFGGRRNVDWLTGEQLPRIC